MLDEVYSRIRSSIVAFTPRFPQLIDPQSPDHLSHIFGTGFIVGDSLIATNRHVIEVFRTLPKPADYEGIPVTAAFFTRTGGGIGVCMLSVVDGAIVSNIRPKGHYYGTELPDLALASVACSGLQRFALTCDPMPARAGIEVATAGFPLGSRLLAPSGQIERFGPVLQRGIISAESPFQNVIPHAYLIDIMVQGGASGSPVFRIDNGNVVGVLYAAQQEVSVASSQSIEIAIQVPTSFSYVVPATILLEFMNSASKHLKETIPEDSPTIDEIIDDMPQTPVDQLTTGHYQKPSKTD